MSRPKADVPTPSWVKPEDLDRRRAQCGLRETHRPGLAVLSKGEIVRHDGPTLTLLPDVEYTLH